MDIGLITQKYETENLPNLANGILMKNEIFEQFIVENSIRTIFFHETKFDDKNLINEYTVDIIEFKTIINKKYGEEIADNLNIPNFDIMKHYSKEIMKRFEDEVNRYNIMVKRKAPFNTFVYCYYECALFYTIKNFGIKEKREFMLDLIISNFDKVKDIFDKMIQDSKELTEQTASQPT